ncbi:MAG: histidine kinase [Bacteroidota bacterium]
MPLPQLAFIPPATDPSENYWTSWWFLSAVILTIFSLLWAVFYTRLAMLKKQNMLLKRAFQSEQKALRAQMTPHFIFNALNSIQHLVGNDQKAEAVSNMSKFSRLMRKILHNSKYQSIPLSEELETLELYLQMESLRFEGFFQYEIDVDAKIDPDDVEIPSMLIQPFVENALWHGIMNKKNRKGKVHIGIENRNDMLVCSITDNGVGRKAAAALNKNTNYQSSGMEITRERLRILNLTRGSSLSMNVIDL